MAIIIIGMNFLLFISSIALWILSFKLFKKRKTFFAIILTAIGILFVISPVYAAFRTTQYIAQNNHLSEYDYSEYDYIEEFIQINHGFKEKYISNKKTIAGINLEINGYINGKGVLSIRPNEENEHITILLEGNIEEKINNMDWYVNEIIMEFIPENVFIDGKILIKIDMY